MLWIFHIFNMIHDSSTCFFWYTRFLPPFCAGREAIRLKPSLRCVSSGIRTLFAHGNRKSLYMLVQPTLGHDSSTLGFLQEPWKLILQLHLGWWSYFNLSKNDSCSASYLSVKCKYLHVNSSKDRRDALFFLTIQENLCITSIAVLYTTDYQIRTSNSMTIISTFQTGKFKEIF